MKYSKYYYVLNLRCTNVGQDKVIISSNRITTVFITKLCGKEQQEDILSLRKNMRERLMTSFPLSYKIQPTIKLSSGDEKKIITLECRQWRAWWKNGTILNDILITSTEMQLLPPLLCIPESLGSRITLSAHGSATLNFPIT
jgi:hypothetical protein